MGNVQDALVKTAVFTLLLKGLNPLFILPYHLLFQVYKSQITKFQILYGLYIEYLCKITRYKPKLAILYDNINSLFKQLFKMIAVGKCVLENCFIAYDIEYILQT